MSSIWGWGPTSTGEGLLARGGAYRKKRTPLCRGFAKEWGGLLTLGGAYRKNCPGASRPPCLIGKRFENNPTQEFYLGASRRRFRRVVHFLGGPTSTEGGLLRRRGAYREKRTPLCRCFAKEEGGLLAGGPIARGGGLLMHV